MTLPTYKSILRNLKASTQRTIELVPTLLTRFHLYHRYYSGILGVFACSTHNYQS